MYFRMNRLLFLALLILKVFTLCSQSETVKNMEQRLTIITLGVDDINESTEFYEQKFGWKKSEVSNENITFFNLNGLQLALFKKTELAKW